ncbi:MAG: hypothetical protein B6I38_07530 [Anaerolineaceae bacterium 4572_5.1]|nr:MAG: hypothetical protein B6I38_07530 [Anaerolineaceae bacterium 4572_5.1]
MQHSDNVISPPQTNTPPALVRLTVEVALYIVIVSPALGLRLFNLSAYPLTNAEASQALAALDIYNGQVPEITGYSPLMASLMSFAFVLFSPSDWAARLPAVLLGTILVALPFGLRKQLGIFGALATSILLTVSATTLFWSRAAGGDIAVAVGLLLLLLGGVKFLTEGESPGLYAIAAGVVFLLLSAPAGYTALLVLGIVTLIVWIANRGAFSATQEKVSAAGDAFRGAVFFFAGLFFVLATAGLFNLTGVAVVSEIFTVWLGQFQLQMQPGAGFPAIFNLLFYEPLILLFGLAGVVAALWNRHLLDWLLATWTAIFLIIDLAMGARSEGQILLAALPLALLAGKQIGLLLEGWQTEARLDAEGLFAAIGLMVSVFIYISLVAWTKCTPAQAGCNTAWILPVAGVALLSGLSIVFWMWYGPKMAWRGAGLVLLFVGGVLSLGAAWKLSYSPLSHLPYQPMLQLAPSTRLPAMMDEIERLSMARLGDSRQIDVVVADLDEAALRWSLRNFRQARFEPDFHSADNASLIIARPDAGQPLEGAYVGQDFALVSFWTPNLLQGKEWLRWYLYRHLPTSLPGSDQVVLWAKTQE